MEPVAPNATVVLPPDHDTPQRHNIERWHSLRYRPLKTQTTAINHPKFLGGIFSGLLQALPPTITPDTYTPPVDPADLLDEGGSDAAALSTVFLRPVHDGTGWTVQTVRPNQVHAVWAHRRLVKALVWQISTDPRSSKTEDALALVETWDNLANEGNGQVTVSVYEGELKPASGTSGARFESSKKITDPDDKLREHPFFKADRHPDTPRRLTAVVHDWEDGQPAPVYAQNEGMMDGLERLADQEQEDAELARHRIAMPEDFVGRRRIIADDGVTVLSEPGFRASDNLLVTPPGLTSQQQEGKVTPIVFPDSLTQRERIERRTNELLEACGISPASIGRNVTGRTDSGAAKRADQQMTLQTATGPARRWSVGLSDVYTQLATLNETPVGSDGVSVRVVPGLRMTPQEAAETAAEQLTAEAASTATRVRTLHPDWTQDQIDDEVTLVLSESAAPTFD